MKTISLLLACSILSTCMLFGQGTGQNFLFSSYSEFDLERGYEPGAFVVIKHNRIESPIITRERLTNIVVNKSLLGYTKPVQIPNTKLNRLKIFKSDLKLKAKYQNIDPEIYTSLNKVNKVELVVNKGESYMFESGSIALTDIIFALPKSDLEKIKIELENKRKVFMITEVIKYDSASLFFQWGIDIDAKLKFEISKIVEFGTSNNWLDNGILEVKYSKGQIVGYKAIKLEKKYIELIQSRIEYREKNGDEGMYFIDKDGDGFGDRNSQPKYYPEKLKPENYVCNNYDCYDSNKDVHPNQTAFFLTHRGDGSFDYNCDDIQEKERTVIGSCNDGYTSAEPQGWKDSIPECGVEWKWLDDCDYKLIGGRTKEYSTKRQKCR